MKKISQIIDGPLTAFTGSEITKTIVENVIKEKYGEAELRNVDCYHNVRTFNSWLKLGFRVRKNEHAIRSITYVEDKDLDSNTIRKYRKPVFLFYVKQVEPIGPIKSV